MRKILLLVFTLFSAAAAHADFAIFDPARALWSSAPQSLDTQRYNFTATVLNDGRVLVAGGLNQVSTWLVGGLGKSPVAEAAVYDPQGEHWLTISPMHVTRYWHTAIRLLDGRILVSGGANDSGGLSECEIFDPKTGSWELAAPMSVARSQHGAVLLQDGRVLVTGGLVDGNSSVSTEVYDPLSNKWVTAGEMQEDARRFVPVTLLQSGKVLIEGGGNFKNSAEVFDPTTLSWKRTASMRSGRYGQSATIQKDGTVLVVGGYGGKLLDTAEVFDPSSETWSPVKSLMGGARYFHTATPLVDGRTLIVGGVSDSSVLQNLEVYDPQTKVWTPAALKEAGFRFHRAVPLPDGRVFIFGGDRPKATL